MPDWFYHPIYKPLVMQTIPGEQARRVTLLAMQLQGAIPAGRTIFKWLASTQRPIRPPANVSVEAFGLRFPSPIGLAPGIDISGTALSLWSYLGLGFIQLGPVTAETIPSTYATHTRCLKEFHSIVTSDQAGCPGVVDIATQLRKNHQKRVPIGVYLREPNPIKALCDIHDQADFITLPWTCAIEIRKLNLLRSATSKPLLLRLSFDGVTEAQQLRAVQIAFACGFNGCVAAYGARCDLLPRGLIHGPQLRPAALSLVSRIANRFGDLFPIIGAGGILTPDDAMAFLQAGAKLVELYEGFVYSGPGLAKRIILKLGSNLRDNSNSPTVEALRR